MLSLINIWNVARVEAKTLWRSWFFRVFAGLALALIVAFDVVVFALHLGERPWAWRGIPSSLPYSNLLLLNVVQAVIAVFLASDFLKRDRRLDTTEVIYMRSMTNGDYVLGKTLGILLVFLGLNLVVLAVALVFNVFFADIPVCGPAYAWYPILLGLPTLVFILGLSFVIMTLIQNQPVTFVILIGYIAITLLYLSRKLFGVFDYIGFYLPLLYSDFVGFGDLEPILLQRSIYFCLGLSGVFAAVVGLRRLPQSVAMQVVARIAVVAFAAAGIGLGATFVGQNLGEQRTRAHALELNRKFSGAPLVWVERLGLNIQAQGKQIAAEARLRVRNPADQPVSEYLFRLNPGLHVTSVEGRNAAYEFARELHLLRIRPDRPLLPGETDSLAIRYSGRVEQWPCFLDVPDDQLRSPHRFFLYTVQKGYAFVRPNFVLLTPEAMWYPQAGVGFDASLPEYFPRQLVQFELTVRADSSLMAISQGDPKRLSPGVVRFVPERPLPGITLVLAPYRTASVTVDSVEYSLAYLPGHDYFRRHLTQIADTVAAVIRDERERYEADLGLYYPYRRLRLVEVPIQFVAYPRLWTLARETVQPEIVLFPEKAVLVASADFEEFRRRILRFRRFRGITLTEKEIQTRAFSSFLRATFLSGVGGGPGFGRPVASDPFAEAYRIFPNYLSYTHNLHSRRWPVFQAALEAYFASLAVPPEAGAFRILEGITEEEKVHIALTERTFLELLRDPSFRASVPYLIKEEGEHLLYVLMSRIGPDALMDLLYDYLDRNAFKNVELEDFVAELRRRFGFEFGAFLDNWLVSRKLPAYLFSPIESYSVLDEGYTRYQVRFKATNLEEVDGVLRLSFRTGGRGFGFGPMGGGQEVERLVYLKGGETKEIGVVLDDQPRMMTVKTFVSRNLPSTLMFPLGDLPLNEKALPFDGERVTRDPVQPNLPGEIVVDNEDPGFRVEETQTASLVRRLLRRRASEEEKYVGMRFWNPPADWKATIDANYFGRIVRSAHFVRSGTGDKVAAWMAQLPENGYYEVYTYVPRMRGFGRGPRERERPRGKYHFRVYHAGEVEEVILDLGQAEEGWNSLGSFYFTAGEARVELSNESDARVVVADAVKWVRR
jgi:ABC-type transport system involved in multi-copper enzyme maturation permease subunit